MIEPPKDINFDPNKQLHTMVKGSKAVKKYFKGRDKK